MATMALSVSCCPLAVFASYRWLRKHCRFLFLFMLDGHNGTVHSCNSYCRQYRTFNPLAVVALMTNRCFDSFPLLLWRLTPVVPIFGSLGVRSEVPQTPTVSFCGPSSHLFSILCSGNAFFFISLCQPWHSCCSYRR
jgi:hypothetical protein